MKTRSAVEILMVSLVIGVLLLPMGVAAQVQPAGGKLVGGPAGVTSPHNPVPFQNFVVSPSGPVRFLLSDAGKALLSRSPNPKHQELLRALGGNVSAVAPHAAAPVPQPPIGGVPTPQTAIVGPIACSPGGAGTVFNLEPALNALPQNEQSIDFKLNGVSAGLDLVVQGSNDYRGFSLLLSGVTGYYVAKGTCNPSFEGALPPVADPLQVGNTLEGGGDPVVAFDPARDAFFMADLRFDFLTTGIGVFRTTAATLLNPALTVCPPGTHTAAQATTCWPTKRVVNPLPSFSSSAFFQDKPHLAVDQRAQGVGAGNVYVTGTEFSFLENFSRIWLVACNNGLTACSAPVLVSSADTATQFSHVGVRPDGGITITYVNVVGPFQIKYVRCTPSAAPATPSCLPPVLVHTETQPIPFGGRLAAQDLRITTYPKHATRVDANGTETYVVWDRCKVPLVFGSVCPDADIVMKASNNNGVTWLPAATVAVDLGLQDQFWPWISADTSTRNILSIMYYTSELDPTFQHRVRVKLAHIIPGAVVPDPVNDRHFLTTVDTDPSADPSLGGSFFGDYIGVSARGNGVVGGSRAWGGFTYTNRQGTYNGALAPQQDNNAVKITY